MTSTQPNTYWAVSDQGKVHILIGSQDEGEAKEQARAIWPEGAFLGVVDFVEIAPKYLVCNKADFYPTTNAADAKTT